VTSTLIVISTATMSEDNRLTYPPQIIKMIRTCPFLSNYAAGMVAVVNHKVGVARVIC
jgi:hypothetical protein